MSTQLDVIPASQPVALVTFTWGEPTQTLRLVRSNADLTVDSDLFIAEPKMEVMLGRQKAGISPDSATIRVATRAELSPFLDSPGQTVSVLIEESDLTLTGTVRRVFLFGYAKSISSDSLSAPGVLEIEVEDLRSELDAPAVMVLSEFCQNKFGHAIGCMYDLVSQERTGIMTLWGLGQPNTVVRVAGLTDSLTQNGGTTNVADLYSTGQLVRDGVSIRVRHYNSAVEQEQLLLQEEPPASWVGQIVSVFPGCRHTIADCRRFQNEIHFNGLGIGTPNHNPLIEEGESSV